MRITESTGTATFVLTRHAGLLAGSATVAFRTVDGGASSATDYAASSGTVTFAIAPFGATQFQQVLVDLRADALDEDDEAFALVLSGDELARDSATATIVDDDPPPVLSVDGGPAVVEGPGAQATFTVRLSASSGRRVTVPYVTADSSATAGQDYTAASGTVAFSPGETSAAVAVAVLDDSTHEPAETFDLRLGSLVATATIADDDQPPAPPAAPAGGGGAGGTQVPSNPSVALPTLGSTTPATGTTAGSSSASLGVSSPRLQRPSTVLVTVSCPAAAGRCNGQITIFSIPNRRSQIKALRRERKLGRLRFAVAGGRAQTLQLKLGRSDLALLRRTGRLRVRAYALTRDTAGRTGVRSVSGTLIARTAHSSPSRR